MIGSCSIRALVFAFLLLGTAISHAADAPFVVRIAVLEQGGELAHRSASSHFHVLLENTSTEPQNVWEWGNSWGWFTPTFELRDSSGNSWLAGRRKDMRWSMNAPRVQTIKPGEIAVINVYFGDENIWEGFPLEKGKPTKVLMKAIFEIHESVESEERNVWTGRVESKQVDVTFVRWK